MNFDWILKIADVEKHISSITKDDEEITTLFNILIKYNGVTAFIKLYELFKKADIRFPFKHITELKKVYVAQNPQNSALVLSQLLDLDVATIYAWRRGKTKSKSNKSRNNILKDLLD